MRKRKDQAHSSSDDGVLPGQLPLPSIEPVAEPEEDTAPEKLVVMPEKVSPAAKASTSTKWRVMNEKYVNINGSFTRVVEGQIIDPLGYSEQSIASLRTQGVELEPV